MRHIALALILYLGSSACAGVSAQDVLAKAAAPQPIVHRVAAGETLYAISRRYGVPLDVLRSDNDLSGNTIYVGQQLRIAGQHTASETVPAARPYSYPPSPPAGAYTPIGYDEVGPYHTVRPGETIASLALRFGYTQQRFRQFNDLGDEEVIAVGRRVRTSHCSCSTPTSPDRFAQHPRPRPSSPSPDYVPPPPLGDRQTPTRTVAIPPPARPAPLPPPPAYGHPRPDDLQVVSSPVGADGRTQHRVRDGDSLYGIARQYGVSVDQLRELNDLYVSDVIVPGSRLYVN